MLKRLGFLLITLLVVLTACGEDTPTAPLEVIATIPDEQIVQFPEKFIVGNDILYVEVKKNNVIVRADMEIYRNSSTRNLYFFVWGMVTNNGDSTVKNIELHMEHDGEPVSWEHQKLPEKIRPGYSLPFKARTGDVLDSAKWDDYDFWVDYD
jgi:hypothetical protein